MAVDKKKLQKGPDLDRFLEVGKRRFTTYARGAGMYSLNYYTFVNLVKECGWNTYVHQHFFFSPNDNYRSPKLAVDLGEIEGRLGESISTIHPSIISYSPVWAERSKNAENISKREP